MSIVNLLIHILIRAMGMEFDEGHKKPIPMTCIDTIHYRVYKDVFVKNYS